MHAARRNAASRRPRSTRSRPSSCRAPAISAASRSGAPCRRANSAWSALRLLRPDGPGRVPHRPGPRRPPAPAYRPRHRHLSLLRPGDAPRQPGHGIADRAGCHEPDDRGCAASPIPSARPTGDRKAPSRLFGIQAWVALPRRPRGVPTRLQPSPEREPPRHRQRRCSSAADRGLPLRRHLARADGARDPLRRYRHGRRRPAADRRGPRGARPLPRRRHGRDRRRPARRRPPPGAAPGRRAHRHRRHEPAA
jgi:hypothetical protein